MGWYSWRNRMLSYEGGLVLAKRARSKEAGKRLNARVRIKIDGEKLELLADGKRIAWIHPDDTATLFFPRIGAGQFYKQWLGIYDLYHPTKKKLAVIATRHLWRGEGWRKTAVPAVDGVRFCLLTGECLNPTPWPERVQTDKSGPWRSKVAKFRRTLKVMAKMGAFQSLQQEVWPVDANIREPKPPITAEELHQIIMDMDPHKLVRRMLETSYRYTHESARAGQLQMDAWPVENFNRLYNKLRDDVRSIEGCYIMETPHESGHAIPSAA